MAVLGAPLPLHDVRDLEAFTWETINRSLGAGRRGLSSDDVEDLFAYLLERSVVAAKRYDESRAGEHPSFAGYLLHMQRFRVVDWLRAQSRINRSGRPNPRFISFEELRSDAAGERELERALGGSTLDVADRVAARGWVDAC